MRKRIYRLLISGCLCAGLLFTGCARGQVAGLSAVSHAVVSAGTSGIPSTMAAKQAQDYYFSAADKETGYDEKSAVQITLEKDTALASAPEAVQIKDSTITITKGGVYVLSGQLTDKMIVVETSEEEKVRLVLNGASIVNSDGAALYVKEADKVFVTTVSGTENELTGAADDAEADTPDATVYATSDLTINGEGSLIVNAGKGSGIHSKDELVVTGGELTVNAQNHGLSGKDGVSIGGGVISVTTKGDGIHAKGSSEETKEQEGEAQETGQTSAALNEDGTATKKSGYVYISDGTVLITSEDEGIQGAGAVIIDGGMIDIKAAQEGIEGFDVIVNGGELDVEAGDDGINATSKETSASDAFAAKDGMGTPAGDPPEAAKGADAGEAPAGGPQGMQKSTDRGTTDGVSAPTSDDGKSAGQPAPGSRMDGGGQPPAGYGPDSTKENQAPAGGQRPGGGGGGMDAAQANVYIQINGGQTTIKASGDGLDSNGDLYITGGEIYVEGPEDNGNGALDYNGDGIITGGTLAAFGSAGMAMTLGSDSTQGTVMVNTGSQNAGDAASLSDADGNVLMSYAPTKSYANVVLSTKGVEKGQTYTVTAGAFTNQVTAG